MIGEGHSPSRYELTSEGDMNEITIEDFAKLDLRVATVEAAEAVEGTDKLVKLMVNAGDPLDAENKIPLRTIVAGVRQFYQPDTLVGTQIVIVANLAPRKMRGIESHGMLLAAKDEYGLHVVTPDAPMQAGAKVG